ncbi:hypothetical protein BBK82_15070 [Lentzea guizhouensis]|uniref:S1 motif domain-containing protein n=1 Tax=Lentzea guizhouensis TaxID=1586287 RepID=A0A1B2HHJ8_9PSEU|nr:hypothetical protein BBK82_15070 [Lentzea guizhouensis]
MRWESFRAYLSIGQQLTGTVDWVPRPGVIGVGVDLDLPFDGFVDVLWLPRDAERWPRVGTVTTFEVVWLDDRQQIRLKPLDPAFQVDDDQVDAPTCLEALEAG